MAIVIDHEWPFKSIILPGKSHNWKSRLDSVPGFRLIASHVVKWRSTLVSLWGEFTITRRQMFWAPEGPTDRHGAPKFVDRRGLARHSRA